MRVTTASVLSNAACNIGFAIPITKMFNGGIVWRGIVYTILMLFAKIVTGIWLIRINISWPNVHISKRARAAISSSFSCLSWIYGKSRKEAQGTTNSVDRHELQTRRRKGADRDNRDVTSQLTAGQSSASGNVSSSPVSNTPPSSTPKINSPLSLYPAAMLGTAMTARGEIGFLIVSLAETTGLFASSTEPRTGSSEIYLVVTWAIVMCTIIGPLGVGMLVRRVRKLQSERKKSPGGSDPLGIWGLS